MGTFLGSHLGGVRYEYQESVLIQNNLEGLINILLKGGKATILIYANLINLCCNVLLRVIACE